MDPGVYMAYTSPISSVRILFWNFKFIIILFPLYLQTYLMRLLWLWVNIFICWNYIGNQFSASFILYRKDQANLNKMAGDYYGHTNLSQPHHLDNGNGSTSSEWDYDDYIQGIYDQTRRRVYPEIHEYFLIAIYFIIFFVAIVGNSMVCIAILKNDHMRTVTNYYIMNLATTDIMIAVVCLPITITVDVSESWFFGQTACYLIPYFQVRLT